MGRIWSAFCLSLYIIPICILMVPSWAAGSQIYYINGKPVLLLYKIINWWYDCLPQEASKLCGSRVECQNIGNIRITYDNAAKKLTLTTIEGFAQSLSIFRSCDQCQDASYLKATWLNPYYFGNSNAIVAQGKDDDLGTFCFSGVDIVYFDRIKHIAPEIGVALEGSICGLMSGKISLHDEGEMLKSWESPRQSRGFTRY